MCRALAARDDAVVTAETGAQNRVVVDPCDRAPVGGPVAILTAVGRRDMAWVFTLGGRSVVAKHAVTGNVDMVELPVVGRVAVVTGIAARHVSRMFSRRNDVVMAAYTAADDDRMIDPGDVGPVVGGMAVIAIADNANMVIGCGAGLDPAGIGVAIDATSWCADEYSLQVAGFAGFEGVFEVERETGFVVVEIRSEVQRRGRR